MIFIVLLVSCNEYKISEKEFAALEPACKAFIICMYYNRENPDKSACVELAKGCNGANNFTKCMSVVDRQADTRMDFKDCLLQMK